MSWIKDYRMVRSLEEAETLLSEPGWALLGGGSHLVAKRPPGIDKLIDLLPLGLDGIATGGDRLRLGARLRLQEIADRDDFDGLLGLACESLAHSERLRRQMTLGGEIAWPNPRNELQTALLTREAVVIRHARAALPLAEYLAEPRREGIITALELDAGPGWRHGFHVALARPGARPTLVLAGAARLAGGRLAGLRVALGNLGAHPQRAHALERRLEGLPLDDLAAVSLRVADREGLASEDSPEQPGYVAASVEEKWRLASDLLGEFLAGLPSA